MSAEHSTYLTAFNSFANFSPCSTEIGFCLFLANFSIVVTSSLRSTCVPTSRNGVFWQWCVISGTHYKIILNINCSGTNHGLFLHVNIFNYLIKSNLDILTFSFTFSKDDGLTTEKHTKKTSVWG